MIFGTFAGIMIKFFVLFLLYFIFFLYSNSDVQMNVLVLCKQILVGTLQRLPGEMIIEVDRLTYSRLEHLFTDLEVLGRLIGIYPISFLFTITTADWSKKDIPKQYSTLKLPGRINQNCAGLMYEMSATTNPNLVSNGLQT